MIPSFTSENAKTVSASAIAMSAAATRPAPPPSAWPCTRATTGAGHASIASNICRIAFASATFSSTDRPTDARIQSTSAPAQKLAPSPASTTARARPTSTKACESSKAFDSSSISSASNALRRSGRASVMRSTEPSRSTRSAFTSGILRAARYSRPMLRGAIAAALTPLSGGGAVLDEDAFEPYVGFLAAHGVDGLLALGTTGEGVLFDVDERKRVAELFLACRGRRSRSPCTAARRPRPTPSLLAEHAARGGRRRRRGDRAAVLRARRRTSCSRHFAAAAQACDPLPFYVYEFAARSGYAVPLPVIASLRDEASNFVGLKVSDTPWERFEPYVARRARHLRRPRGADPAGRWRAARPARCPGSPGASPTRSSRSSAIPRRSTARASARFARRCRRCRSTPRRRWCSALRGVPMRGGVRAAAARAARRRGRRGRAHRARMARIVVAGSGAIGASVAYHLALLGADDVVVAERGELVCGSTVARDGRRAAAVLDAGGGRARAREHRVPRRARPAVLPSGRLSLPRDDGGGARRARGAARAAELARRAGRARRSLGRRTASPSTTCSVRPAAGATASPTRAPSHARCCAARRSSASRCASTRRPRASSATCS